MISPMRARVLAQKSEEATASSASLLATPLQMSSHFLSHYSCIILFFFNSLLFQSSEIHGRSCTSINLASTQTLIQRGKEGLPNAAVAVVRKSSAGLPNSMEVQKCCTYIHQTPFPLGGLKGVWVRD